MGELNDIQRVDNLLAAWMTRIRIHNGVDFNDILAAENVALTLLNLVYQLKLKYTGEVQKNSPEVDLVDESNKIAVQVTFAKYPHRIMETLEKFVKYSISMYPNGLRFFIIGNEKPHFTPQKYAGIYPAFDPDIDIITVKDLMVEIKKIYRQDSARFERILAFLERELGGDREAVRGYRKPLRIFEDSGTVIAEKAYYVHLDNVTNTRNQDIQTMIDQGRYFSIFAPRQCGKTTFLKDTCARLHDDPTYVAILLSFQTYKNLDKPDFYSLIEKELYGQLLERLKEVNCEKIETMAKFLSNYHLTTHISFSQLFEELNRILQAKKIIIFIDEFDGIPKNELENFLHALRDLYQKYKDAKQKALYSIGLIGIRDITKLIVGGVSPFNIADQVDLPPFSLENVRDLYAQYTEETFQPFTEEAVKRIYEETAGQPWLVNRLGTILTIKIKPETLESIEESDVEKAIQFLLLEKNSHFDNLYEKAKLYKESFIEIVFDNVKYVPDNKDQGWLEQYGLIKKKETKAVVANSIYKKRFTEAFFNKVRVPGDVYKQTYELPGGRLDMENILLDFSQYITQIGVRAFYQTSKPYEKTGQFLITAWLYRFGSGGGELRYEVSTGLGRMDIILNFNGRKYIIETKVNRDNLANTLNDGIGQVVESYLASESCNEGFLVVFDTKTPVGAECKRGYHDKGDKKVTSFIIGIGRIDMKKTRKNKQNKIL
ncbi:MAG: hypothetical protein QG657_4377 [Acidobacteriota bacterium]|nr:hypothetical protein [Acidobacteriota bacterium]